MPLTLAELEQRAEILTAALETMTAIDDYKKTGAVAAAAGAPRGTNNLGHIERMAAGARADRSPEVPGNGGSAFGVTITAATSARGIVAGSPLTSSAELGELAAEALNALAPDGTDQRRSRLVAMARWHYPENRQLGDDGHANTVRLDAVCGINAPRVNRYTGALVASGGICLPTNVDYTVPTWATPERPLRDGLPGFEATRGGLQFVSPPDIGVPSLQGTASGAGVATGVWTEATDANPAGATKPVWVVQCGSVQEIYVDAIPTRVQFGNMQSRFAPEQLAANTEVAIAVAAREAELNLLAKMYASSTQCKPQQYLGATRDLLSSVDLLREQYLHSHRIPRNASFTAVLPNWAKGLLRADLAREIGHGTAGGDRLAVTDDQIDAWFAIRGIEVLWTDDGLKAGTYGTGGSAIPNQFFGLMATNAPEPQWPGGQSSDGAFVLAWLLFPTGTFQFLDGGRLDLGVVRDAVLDATNDYETFIETFEGIAFRGLEAYQVQSTILPSGGSAGTVASSGYHE